MTNYNFVAYGRQASSSESFARDEIERRAAIAHLVFDKIVVVPETALCKGSEESATTVTVESDLDHPYNRGRCRSCGALVPLLSAGNFEVIKHFAPSNYHTKD